MPSGPDPLPGHIDWVWRRYAASLLNNELIGSLSEYWSCNLLLLLNDGACIASISFYPYMQIMRQFAGNTFHIIHLQWKSMVSIQIYFDTSEPVTQFYDYYIIIYIKYHLNSCYRLHCNQVTLHVFKLDTRNKTTSWTMSCLQFMKKWNYIAEYFIPGEMPL